MFFITGGEEALRLEPALLPPRLLGKNEPFEELSLECSAFYISNKGLLLVTLANV